MDLLGRPEKDDRSQSFPSANRGGAPPQTLEEAYGLIKEMKGRMEHLETQLRDSAHKNQVLQQIAYHISSRKDLPLLYEDIVRLVMREVPSEGGFLMQSGRSRLETLYFDGAINEITLRVLESSPLFSELLCRDGATRFGARDEHLLTEAFPGSHSRIRNLLCLPLKTQSDKKPFGILGLVNHLTGADFTEAQEQFLAIVALSASVALRNLEYVQEIERKYDELIITLANAIEAKDESSRGHAERVKHYASSLAEKEFKLSPGEAGIIRTAAILHDIGKIALPDSILNKMAPLGDDEYLLMKTHVPKAAEILKSAHSLEREIVDIIFAHHEHYDGRGYPRGLRGDEIPFGARLIAVADAFDSMTSNRPYQKGLPVDAALQRMKEFRGSMFDPAVLDAFLKMMSRRIGPDAASSIKRNPELK
jgi:putative nucleotidyltransferase with HDIG domain